MNYIILNNKKLFENKIKIKGFKEVENDKDRCDAVFGEITIPILEELYQFPDRREEILPESWLLTDRGVSFILCKFDKNILHDETGKAIKKLLGIYSKEDFYIEVRSYNSPQSYNQIECYIFCYNKNFGHHNDILPDTIVAPKNSIIEELCQHINIFLNKK